MLLDLGVTTRAGLTTVVKFSELAQKLGFHCLWIGEDINVSSDIFTLISTTLLRNSKIRVGIGITSPLIRNISTIARASVTLTEIAGEDRFILGLGVGGLQDLSSLGISVKNSSALLRDAVGLLRKIWKGETVAFQSEHFKLENYYPRYGLARRIPVYLGVRGPKLLEQAGNIADGVILSGPKKYLTKAVRLVKNCVRRSNNPEKTFKFVTWIPTVLGERKIDVNLAKQSVAVILADTPKNVLEMAELDVEKVNRIKRTLLRFGLEKAAHLVSDELARETVIHGNPQQIFEVFESLENLGIDEVVFGPPYGVNKERAIARLARAWRQRT